jgi:GMP synthase (glutamine-hydrolysing)
VPRARANGDLPALTVAILVAGQPLPEIEQRRGDYERFIRTRTGTGVPVRWVSHDVRGAAPLPGPRDAEAFIVTGSSSSVTERAPWMLRAEELLRQITHARTPVLGICFGHQLLAQALGGEVQRNPLGREIGTVRLARIGDSPLFSGLPRTFDVHQTHVDAVVRPPPGAEVLAATALDAAAAYRLGTRVHAVQFHPEMDADIIRGYVTARASIIRDEGGDPEVLLAGIHDGTRGHDVLRNFVRHVARGAKD